MISSSQLFLAFVIVAGLMVAVSAQQWTPQQIEAYRQQQYYNWYYNQQRAQQQQPVATAAPATAAPSNWHPIWGNAQSDDKGNFWHGDDNAKILLVAKSSWP